MHAEGASLPLRALTDYRICSATDGSVLVPLHKAGSIKTAGMLLGTLVPLDAEQRTSSKRAKPCSPWSVLTGRGVAYHMDSAGQHMCLGESTPIQDCVFQYGEDPCIWVVTSLAWYVHLKDIQTDV